MTATLRNTEESLVHSKDHLHDHVLSGRESIHDPVPYGCPPPAKRSDCSKLSVVYSSSARRAMAHPDRKTQKMPLSTRRSLTRGTPRVLFGNNGLMILHS